jgi:hypothetical protein
MHKRIPVIELDIDNASGFLLKFGIPLNPGHLPIGTYIKSNVDGNMLRDWWMKRSIPASREGLKETLEKLNVGFSQGLLSKSYGLSLSDQYWVCPQGQDLKWDDINFFTNSFSEDMGNLLFSGKMRENSKNFNFLSPDNTSDGMLRKKWKIINGERYLIKSGSVPFRQEVFNEVIASSICWRLCIPHTEYILLTENGEACSASKDFVTPMTELVSAARILDQFKTPNNVSKYEHYIACGEKLGIIDIRQQIEKMLVLDFIIANSDRHYNNFGLLRNAETLAWTGVVPIFDCGCSLFYDKPDRVITISSVDAESKPFKTTHFEQIKLVKDFSWLNFETLNDISDEYAELLKMSELPDERRTLLCKALLNRIQDLKSYVCAFENKKR